MRAGMLTDIELGRLKPAEKPYKRGDERGLYVLGTSKWWQLKYRYGGREKLLSLGVGSTGR